MRGRPIPRGSLGEFVLYQILVPGIDDDHPRVDMHDGLGEGIKQEAGRDLFHHPPRSSTIKRLNTGRGDTGATPTGASRHQRVRREPAVSARCSAGAARAGPPSQGLGLPPSSR